MTKQGDYFVIRIEFDQKPSELVHTQCKPLVIWLENSREGLTYVSGVLASEDLGVVA